MRHRLLINSIHHISDDPSPSVMIRGLINAQRLKLLFVSLLDFTLLRPSFLSLITASYTRDDDGAALRTTWHFTVTKLAPHFNNSSWQSPLHHPI